MLLTVQKKEKFMVHKIKSLFVVIPLEVRQILAKLANTIEMQHRLVDNLIPFVSSMLTRH